MKKDSQTFLIWFTGISGSGKTTLSKKLYNTLKKKYKMKLKLIDGDDFRKKNNFHKYNHYSRKIVSEKKRAYGIELQSKNYNVIISGITAKKSVRLKNRSKIKNYIEVFLKCPFKICLKRSKIKMNRFNKSNIIGATRNNEYNEHKEVEIKIDTNKTSPTQGLKKILKYLRKKNFIKSKN